MNTQEACRILGINIGDSKEIADKNFRDLASKWHPDKNKHSEKSAEDQFKKISEAYQFVKDHGTVARYRGPSQEDMEEIFSRTGVRININGQSYMRKSRVLVGSIELTLVESIVGCSKSVSFNRNVICPKCSGVGIKDCSGCSGAGVIEELKETEIDLPGGVEGESYARIENEGGIVNGQVSDAILEIHIEDDPDLSRVGMDVISYITVSLLDALKGTSKETRTAYGNKTLKIKPGIKNGDTVRVRGFGVAKRGSHIFKVRVEYPEDTSPLVEFLESYPKSEVEEIEGE